MPSSALVPLASHHVKLGPPSMLWNNLFTADESGILVYVTGGSVARYGTASKDVRAFVSNRKTITSLHAVPPHALVNSFSQFSPIFVLSSCSSGLELFSNNKVVASIPLDALALPGADGSLHAAVSTVPTTTSVAVMAGSASGAVVFFDALLIEGGGATSMQPSSAPVDAHEGKCITSVDIKYSETNSSRLGALAVSGDTTGRVVLWNYDRQPYLIVPVQDADCVTTVRICNEVNLLVAAAMGSGKINIHSAVTGALQTSIRARSCFVTGLVYSPIRGGLLASCAEDSVVSVWALPAANATTVEGTRSGAASVVEVRHIGSALIENWLPSGVAFSTDGAAVKVAAYDCPELQVLAMP